jgi:lysophospholipase L1-like esterase
LAGPAALIALVSSPVVRGAGNLGQIMALGDSITYGTNPDDSSTGYNTPGGYRARFYTDVATNAGYSFTFVGSQTANPGSLPAGEQAQEGHPGFIIGRSVNRVGTAAGSDGGLYANLSAATMTESGTTGTPYINASAQPSTILLMAGTNNILLNYNVNAPPASAASYNPYTQGPYKSDAEMKDLLTATFAALPTTHVYLATIPQIAATPANTNSASSSYFNFYVGAGATGIATADAQIQEYNQDLGYLATQFAALGDKITLVDIASKFTLNADDTDPNGYYSSDGIHPSDAGYQVIGDAFASAVLASAPEPTSALLLAATAGPLLCRRRHRRAGRPS